MLVCDFNDNNKWRIIMKKLFLIILTLLFFSTLLLSETTIRITNGEWEPYLSKYSYKYGLASHIVSEAFKLEEITVKWGFYPWKRSYENAKYGQNWDASAVWWPTEEAKKDFFISVPVVKTSHVFFHLKSYKFDWKTIEDLKGIQIGFTLGYDYGRNFMRAIKENKINVQTVVTDEQNFKKIFLNRIDIFPNDQIVGYSQLKNIFSEDEVKLFTHHPKEFGLNTLNLIISKKSKNGKMFLEKFNLGMKKLKESGKLDQMFKDYQSGLYDTKKPKGQK